MSFWPRYLFVNCYWFMLSYSIIEWNMYKR
jgi:hypothetical protein